MLSIQNIEKYLSQIYGFKVKVKAVTRINNELITDLKGFGYGIPYLIEFFLKRKIKRVVLGTIKPSGFGHERFSDRASLLLWQHSAFNKLYKHVKSIDVGTFHIDGVTLSSLGNCQEFFILTEFVEGTSYHVDLDKIKERKALTNKDEKRCLALSNYLVKIHSVKEISKQKYLRSIRDLIGHGEGIFGLTDSYRLNSNFIDEDFLINFEKLCINWRWRLKKKTNRLSQIHGDFHPWNVLFRQGEDFTVLDRSRGIWGDPADDVTAMTINYLFYSLQTCGSFSGIFEKLFLLFWRNYLDKTSDEEILNIVQPFYAWRSLVLASPVWYPNLSITLRKKILSFALGMLKSEEFDFKKIPSYLNDFI